MSLLGASGGLTMEEDMKRVLSALILLPLFSHPVRAEEPVYFADPHFKAAVEGELWILDPTPTDMLGLTSLSAVQHEITNLGGLDYALNLQTLNLAVNDISTVSPLAGLSNLQTLILNNNNVSDISALSGLSNLRHLDIHDNPITDLSPVSGLSHLEEMVFHNNQISSIPSLSALTRLRLLDLLGNQISDIAALTDLTSLKILDLRQNPLNQDAYSIDIPQIRANNPGINLKHDPRVPRQLMISSTLGGTVIDPGEGRFMYEGGEIVRLEAKAAPGFVFVNWSGTFWSVDNPIYITLNQDHHIQADFVGTAEFLYNVDDDASNDPGWRDADLSDPQEDGSSGHPYDCIQEAIAVAADGTSILVRPGTYRENIDFLGKRIQLLGIDANDPSRASYPVIDGAGAGPVVTFTAGEDPNCLLMGFVITGGYGTPAGAIYCNGSSPTIVNCLITGNRATGLNAAAVYCCDSNAVFVNCTIADNDSIEPGAGFCLIGSNVILTNSILWGNTTGQILMDHTSQPALSYCDVAGGWPGEGNIDADPLFVRRGYWADAKDSDVLLGPDNPDANWMDGDYHLQSEAGRWDNEAQTWVHDEVTSPCIDAGDPVSPVGDEPLPNGDTVNMGTYGGTAEAGKSHFNFQSHSSDS